MSIEAKHAYRFGFLKSEKWDQIRLETLVAQKGKCFICGNDAWNNDVHHVVYSSDWYHSTNQQLVVLCRQCHEFAHDIIKRRTFEKKSERWQILRQASKIVKTGYGQNLEQKPKRVSACSCCGSSERFSQVNILEALGLTWTISLCDACLERCKPFVTDNIEQMKTKPQEPYVLLKRFFKTVRSLKKVVDSPAVIT